MNKVKGQILDWVLLLKLSILVQLGRRYWIVMIAVLVWPLIQALMIFLGWRETGLTAVDAQNFLIGTPLYCVAIGIGVKIIAHEIEQRTLEVSYTVPGGSRRVWISKLIAVTLLLLCVEVLLVLATSLFFNDFTVSAIYGAFQGAVFFLVFAMWAGALVKNELVAVLLTLCVGYFNMTSTSSRWSPLFNPIEVIDVGTGELFAWSIQNHVGFAILILGIAFLAFSRADRSEVMLAD